MLGARDTSRRTVAGIALGRRRPLGRRCQGRQIARISGAGQRQSCRCRDRRGWPLPPRSALGLRGRAAADRRRRHGGRRCRIPLENENFSLGNADPATNAGPIFQQLDLRDLRVPPQLSRRSGCRRPRAPARGRGRAPRVAPDGRELTFRMTPVPFSPRPARPSPPRPSRRPSSGRCCRSSRCWADSRIRMPS